MAYNGTIDLISGIRPKNNGSFPLVKSHDVYIDDETRLDEKLQDIETNGGDAAKAMVAPKEATSTASASHPTGSYFTYNNVLYEATDNIAVGDTITPGTNCMAKPGGLGNDVTDLKSAINDIKDAISSDPVQVQTTLLDYGVSPIVVASNVTIHDDHCLNSSGTDSSATGSMWYEFSVSAGDSFSITGRLGNYAVVLFDGTTQAKIYLIADIGAEITSSGKGTYNSSTKSFADWNLIIPDYNESSFPYHVDKIGITAASYDTTPTSNSTPVCKQNETQSELISSKALQEDIAGIQNGNAPYVTYTGDQSLTDAEKATARNNVDAADKAVESAVLGDSHTVLKTVLNYSTNPATIDSGVTIHDGYVLNSSGNNASSSGSMWYEFSVLEGKVYTISGRLSNYSVVLFAGSTKAKIYLIADVGAEITSSGKGTYNSNTKSFTGWELTIPEYNETTFPFHVDKIGITAASYTLGSVDNATPICTTTYEESDYIKSQDLLDAITALQTDAVYRDTPITNFPVYLKNVIAYKPTGAFAKPYICLSTDDGREGMIHQTIEMVVDEAHVPVTFCIHSHSDIFYAQKRKKYTLAQVASAIGGAITNYGCELALHDNHLWADKDATHKTPYTEKTLAEYVANEQAFFANPYEIDTETPLGVSWTLKSASAPEHATDQIVCGLMGGTFGVLRSGDTTLGMMKNIYDYKCIGARTNLYCLPCKNFNSGMYNTLQKCKDAVDYAIANNLVLSIFWHEAIMADSTTESDANEHITDAQISDLLLPMIAYAKQQNVEFVTLSQIQNLI